METQEHFVKRLRMRSIRRGIKEMDIILGHFSEMTLDSLSDEQLQNYDVLLSENDHDLYAWVSGALPPPDKFSEIISKIAQKMAQKMAQTLS